MPDARCTRSLACENEKAHERRHHRFTGFTQHSLRNGFNGFLRALPGDRALLPPSLGGLRPPNLTPASGRQDHTTSPSAKAPFVRARIAHAALRPPHPVPNVRDDRDTPLLRVRDVSRSIPVSTKPESEKFFARGLDRQIRKQPVGQISDLSDEIKAPCEGATVAPFIPATPSESERANNGGVEDVAKHDRNFFPFTRLG
jgi:hypothetical protein